MFKQNHILPQPILTLKKTTSFHNCNNSVTLINLVEEFCLRLPSDGSTVFEACVNVLHRPLFFGSTPSSLFGFNITTYRGFVFGSLLFVKFVAPSLPPSLIIKLIFHFRSPFKKEVVNMHNKIIV